MAHGVKPCAMSWVPVPGTHLKRCFSRILGSQLNPTNGLPVSENKGEASEVTQWVKEGAWVFNNK